MEIASQKCTYLVRGKAELVVHGHFEDRDCVLDTHDRRTTQVTVWVVAVAESQAVYAAVTVVGCCAVVEESSDAATLHACQHPD